MQLIRHTLVCTRYSSGLPVVHAHTHTEVKQSEKVKRTSFYVVAWIHSRPLAESSSNNGIIKSGE